ncbi:MAG: DUF2796 domain-containing protein [Rhodocyclaceae bacterium]
MFAMKTRHVVGGLCLLAVPFLAAAAGGAHEHGVAHLSLVQEGSTITLGFESPLDSLVGFEHAPRTDQQKQALRQARAVLENAGSVVAAACVARAVTVEMPFGEAAHAGHDDHDKHADADAEYVFECVQPAALDTVTVGLFKAFPRLQRIDAEAATAAGQGKTVLRPAQATWSLPPAR